MPTGRAGSLAVAAERAMRRGKPRRFQAVIDQLEIGRRRERPQMVEVHPAAGDQPAASAIFSRFSQSGMVQTSLACAEML